MDGDISQKGFTLIELLVVIAIIGVLSAVALFAINPLDQVRRSRDSTRIQEVLSIRKAIDLTVTSRGAEILNNASCPYADPCTSDANNRASNGTGWIPVDISEFLPVLPVDPRNGIPNVYLADGSTATPYYYFASDGLTYTIATYLESDKNEPLLTSDGGSQAGLYEVGTGVFNPITIN